MIFSDETIIRLNTVKRLVWNLPGKKKIIQTVKYSSKVNVWGCFSSQDFARIVCFKQDLNPELMCDIYKCSLLLTARTQFGLYLTIWELQEDHDVKHMWKVSHEIKKLDWPPISPDLVPIKNVWQLLKA